MYTGKKISSQVEYLTSVLNQKIKEMKQMKRTYKQTPTQEGLNRSFLSGQARSSSFKKYITHLFLKKDSLKSTYYLKDTVATPVNCFSKNSLSFPGICFEQLIISKWATAQTN